MSTSAGQAAAAAGERRLAVAVETERDRGWAEALDFAAKGISPFFVPLSEVTAVGTPGQGRIATPEPRRRSSGMTFPDFAGIAEMLDREKPQACLTLFGGTSSRLAALAADALGIPVFSLIATEEELLNASRRRKSRPDLFFLADSRLFPAALDDARYGSTMLPTGHPARDLGDPACADAFFGDGKAASRILTAIGKWWDGTLDPACPELSVIVPAFREAPNLPLVCERLLAAFEREPIAVEFLLVDDASPDDTYAVAIEQMWRSPRIRALTKPTPRGMGNAIRRGLQEARAPIVAVTMGDGSDDVGRIPVMFRKVRDEGYALAIGCRYRRPENYAAVPRLYRFWSRCFRIVTRLMIGVKLQDYTNSFRVYHRKIFDRYGPESGGFEISPETTFKAWFATRRITEVDVKHLKRSSGQSKFSFLRAGPGYAKILFKAFVNRLTGRWFVLDW